jgi:hypothetical protein
VYNIGNEKHLSVCLFAVDTRAGTAICRVGSLVIAADVDHVLVESRQSLGGSVGLVLVLNETLGGVGLGEELEAVEEVGLVVIVGQGVSSSCRKLNTSEQGKSGRGGGRHLVKRYVQQRSKRQTVSNGRDLKNVGLEIEWFPRKEADFLYGFLACCRAK